MFMPVVSEIQFSWDGLVSLDSCSRIDRSSGVFHFQVRFCVPCIFRGSVTSNAGLYIAVGVGFVKKESIAAGACMYGKWVVGPRRLIVRLNPAMDKYFSKDRYLAFEFVSLNVIQAHSRRH